GCTPRACRFVLCVFDFIDLDDRGKRRLRRVVSDELHFIPLPSAAASVPSKACTLCGAKPAVVNGAPGSDVKTKGDFGSWSRWSRRSARRLQQQRQPAAHDFRGCTLDRPHEPRTVWTHRGQNT